MIREAIALLESLKAEQGVDTITVGVSGGKDSLVTLDLCAKVFGPANVRAFFLFYVQGLECEEKHLRGAENRYGITIHRLPNPGLAALLRTSALRRRTPSIEQAIDKQLRWTEIERIMRHRTRTDWFAYGHRITDSLQRRGMILASKGVKPKERRCYPIWDWKPADVFSYLRAKRIPLPPMYGSGRARTSGVYPGSPECLLFLRKHYPDDLERIFQVFPHSKDLLAREEVRAAHDIRCPV
ncbi:MAG: phosphoadenosine phosphosulfate reductase family protein [Planctomycetaceae bacterium]|nr:phosphoadenosine phosphosulfate reductase family protein [Planctomycetaceae bacterium]